MNENRGQMAGCETATKRAILRSRLKGSADGNHRRCIRAVEEVWPQSLRIRCWMHKMRNVLDKVPEPVKDDLKAHLVSIRDAASYDDGRKAEDSRFEPFRR